MLGFIDATGGVKSVARGIDNIPELVKMIDNLDAIPDKMQVQAFQGAKDFLKQLPLGKKEMKYFDKLAVEDPRKWLNTIGDFARGLLDLSLEKGFNKITPK